MDFAGSYWARSLGSLVALGSILSAFGLVIGVSWGLEMATRLPTVLVAPTAMDASRDTLVAPPPIAAAKVAPVRGQGTPPEVDSGRGQGVKRGGRGRSSNGLSHLSELRGKHQLSEADVVALLRHSGFPERQIPALVCTVKNESSFLPRARNINDTDGSSDTGLFQINDLWLGECKMTRDELLDPLKNTTCARVVYNQMGLHAWLGFTRKPECQTYELTQAPEPS